MSAAPNCRFCVCAAAPFGAANASAANTRADVKGAKRSLVMCVPLRSNKNIAFPRIGRETGPKLATEELREATLGSLPAEAFAQLGGGFARGAKLLNRPLSLNPR